MKTIRASDIGAYLYCRRAWWYQNLGYESQNRAELLSGEELHARHGRSVLQAGILRALAYGLLLLALVLISIYMTLQLL